MSSARNHIKAPDLVLDNVSFSWPSAKKALNKCSFSIPHPGLWMLVGKNGSGKSTLFRLISGMIAPDEGRIICSFKTGLMFQNPDHQLLMPTCASDILLNIPTNLSFIERKIRIQEVLEIVGLTGMESRPIYTLSGGQKQRLALAGALASNSNLLLLDEPTALLDPVNQKKILEIVRTLCMNRQIPITAIWITHRLQELQYADGAAMMENGQVGPWHSGVSLRKLLKPLARRRV